jgi:carboxymethylenebutenolidase
MTMVEKEARVRTGDGEMRMFAAHPASDGPFPVAVLFMDGVGYREQVKENARRFAAAGYYCVAPDLFYRAGEDLKFDFARLTTGALADSERERMMKIVGTVTPANMVADTKAVLGAIASDPAAEASEMKVCVGYCMGARVALHTLSALAGDFAAASCIHPGAFVTDQPDSPHKDLASVRGELYVAFAEQDRTATPENIDRFRDEMKRKGVRGEVERLPGTAHGFAMADLPVYNHDAAEHHFERTLDLWKRNLT